MSNWPQRVELQWKGQAFIVLLHKGHRHAKWLAAWDDATPDQENVEANCQHYGVEFCFGCGIRLPPT